MCGVLPALIASMLAPGLAHMYCWRCWLRRVVYLQCLLCTASSLVSGIGTRGRLADTGIVTEVVVSEQPFVPCPRQGLRLDVYGSTFQYMLQKAIQHS
jgi:hypothetical protein